MKPSKSKEIPSNREFKSQDQYATLIRPRRALNVYWRNDLSYPLFPLSLFEVTRWDGEWYKHSNYSYLALELVLEGEIRYSDENQIILASAGSIFVIVPHSNVRQENNRPGQKRRKLTLIIGGNATSLLCHALNFDRDTLVRLNNPGALETHMRRIGQVIQSAQSHQKAALLTYELMLQLSQELRQSSKLIPEELQKIRQFLQAHFREKITLKNLVAEFGISEATIRRRFTQYFALTPLNYLNTIRLDYAQNLLTDSTLSVKEVGFRSGFASALYFTEAFRKKFHCSPSAFRQALHQE